MKKKLLLLLGMFALITIIVVITINLTDTDSNSKDNDKTIVIATSFQPIQTIVENLTSGCDNISVINITSNVKGCLHDYQLTSSDMKSLEKAETLVINGAGMESFIEDAASVYPDINIVDSSSGISLIEENELDEHEDEEGHDHESEDSDEHDHEHETNSHFWLSTTRYEQQISNIAKQLSKLYPDYADTINTNKDSYTKKVEKLSKEFADVISFPKGTKVIIFHDAFAYLADEVGLEVVSSIEIDNDASLSAGQIAEVINLIKDNDIKMLFTEKQFSTSIADSIAAETDAKVYVIDSLVSADKLTKDTYFDGMENNLKVLKDVMKENF